MFTISIQRISCLIFCGLIGWNSLMAQVEVPLKNPSFEDIPRAGSPGFPLPITGWMDCAEFPKHSPPDIHSVDFRFWGVTTQPYDGTSFLGLVTRPDGSNECVKQELSQLLKKGKSYKLHLFICQDENYQSRLSPTGELVDFNQPAIVRILGSNYTDVLLAESYPIDHPDWREYTFDLFPTRTYAYLVIEAYFVNAQEPAAGNVLIDNLKLVRIEE